MHRVGSRAGLVGDGGPDPGDERRQMPRKRYLVEDSGDRRLDRATGLVAEHHEVVFRASTAYSKLARTSGVT